MMGQLEQMHALWTGAAQAAPHLISTRSRPAGAAVRNSRPSRSHSVSIHRRRDPVIGTERRSTELRELVRALRAGMVMDLLNLTFHLLVAEIGEDGVLRLLRRFWQLVPPESQATDEAHNFAAYLATQSLPIAHLNEVMSFELACQAAVRDGQRQSVRFSCDPLPLLTALRAGRRPAAQPAGEFQLVVEP